MTKPPSRAADHESRGVGAVRHAHRGAGPLAESLGDPGLERRPEGGPGRGLEELAGRETRDMLAAR